MRIALNDASGSLAQAIVDRLAPQHPIVALTGSVDGAQSLGVPAGDAAAGVRALAGVQCLIVLAHHTTRPLDVAAARALARGAQHQAVRRVVVVSTAATWTTHRAATLATGPRDDVPEHLAEQRRACAILEEALGAAVLLPGALVPGPWLRGLDEQLQGSISLCDRRDLLGALETCLFTQASGPFPLATANLSLGALARAVAERLDLRGDVPVPEHLPGPVDDSRSRQLLSFWSRGLERTLASL